MASARSRKRTPKLPDRMAKQLQTGETINHTAAKQYVSERFPSGKWLAEVRRMEKGRLHRYPRKAFGTAQEALAYILSTRTAGKDGPTVRLAGEKTVTDLYREWKRHAWKNISERTKEEQERRWRLHIEPYWGSWTLSQVRPLAAQEWLTEEEERLGEQGKGHGLAQLEKVRIQLHGMFRFAAKTEFGGFERANPFDGLEARQRPRRSLITIESQHFAPILRAADLLAREGFVTRGALVVPWIVEMFATALLSGLRHGEVMALKGDRLDFANGAIRVDRALRRNAQDYDEALGRPSGPVLRQAVGLPKGDRLREVPMSDQLGTLLRKVIADRGNTSGLLWPGANGRPKEENRFNTSFRTLCRWLDVLAKAVPLSTCQGGVPNLTRWSRLNAIIEEMHACPELRIPDIFDLMDFRDTRNSFSSYLNEVAVPHATHQQIMGHGSTSDVTLSYYTRVTSIAFKRARLAIAEGWSPHPEP